MPLYEYRCEEDGDTLTLLRSMADADAPVEDPEELGRVFHRIHSTFQMDATTAPRGGFDSTGGGCGCGHGGCGH
ncbi:MAG: hypothetical protein P8K80_09960 [Phycisphaerales bacterium]|nr:hypothetical protein [Phycisphaerales bacterium]